MALEPTESAHPMAGGLHALQAADLLVRVLDAQSAAPDAVRKAIPDIIRVAEAGVAVLRSGGRVGYAGAGSSGLMALADCLELPGTFGIAPDRLQMMFAGGAASLLRMAGGVEDDPVLARADLDRSGLASGDLVLCLAASGGTPYTLTIAEEASARGVRVAGLANVQDAPLLRLADIPVFLDTGPEIIAGSTRLAAGTAQKLALNLMSVLIGTRLGHVHDGYMVNLTADNAKLRRRALRMVATLSAQDEARAEAALDAAGGEVKPAVLIARGLSGAEAFAALAASDGHLAPHLSTDQN